MAGDNAGQQTSPQADRTAQAAPQGAAPQWAAQPTMPPQAWHGYYAQPQPPAPAHKPLISNKPTVVSALLALVGVLGIVMAAMFFMGSTVFSDMMGTDNGPFEIHGVVQYTNGSGAPNVTVTLVGTSISTVTDDTGHFVLYNVPSGEQRVQVEKAGFVTLTMKVTVPGLSGMSGNAGERGPDIKFVLSPGSGQAETSPGFEMTVGDVKGLIAICGGIVLVMSILTIVGAYFAYSRSNFAMVIVGTLAGIFTIGFGIGTILAFVALFIVLISSDEFKGKAKMA